MAAAVHAGVGSGRQAATLSCSSQSAPSSKLHMSCHSVGVQSVLQTSSSAHHLHIHGSVHGRAGSALRSFDPEQSPRLGFGSSTPECCTVSMCRIVKRGRSVTVASAAAAASYPTPGFGGGAIPSAISSAATQLQQQQQQQQQLLQQQASFLQAPPEAAPTEAALHAQPIESIPPPSMWRAPSLTAPITWTAMLGYLAFMLILPITALLSKAAAIPPATFLARATEPVSLHAYYVTFSMAAIAAVVNCFFGFLLAWVLVKYDFPGRKWLDAAVDLPFALPTSVAGLTLATVYSDDGWIGQLLASMGVHVVFTRVGVAVAMVFVSFPFVVRTMQPVLQEMEKEMEEAAWSLGASPWDTFTKVLLPPLLPSLLTGTALAFSRALGEFGSIVIVSSNFAFKDLIAPVLIFQCLEQYDFVGATVIGTVLLLASLVLMLLVNQLQSYNQRFKK